MYSPTIRLKSLLVSFEKKITKNQKLRVKYPNDPDKFMASEVELHEEIQELHTVAASPELYYILVDTKAVNSILGMFDILLLTDSYYSTCIFVFLPSAITNTKKNIFNAYYVILS